MECVERGHDRRSQCARPSAAAASWRRAATSDWRPRRPPSGSPRLASASSPASGAPSACRGWSGRRERWKLNLIGDPISAVEAYEIGLATRVVADHELFDTALAWARKLAGQAPLAVQEIKRVSGAGDLDAGIEAEIEGFERVFGSEDAQEGIGAFLGKRPPRFEGR